MWRALPIVLCSTWLAGASCGTEWIYTGPEIGGYTYEQANAICNRWAHRKQRTVFGSVGGTSNDSAEFMRLFRDCMRAHHWELRRKGDTADAKPPPGT